MNEQVHSPRPPVDPGTFCWADLGTPHPEAARRFYAALFGWSAHDLPLHDGARYSVLRRGEDDVAALYRRPRGGAPPSWLSYVSVESADAAAGLARALGGEVLTGPLDVAASGRMAVVRDPAGAVLALWEARGHAGAGRLGRPGSLCWFELMSRDPGRARDFYAGLFGWGSEEMEMDGTPYTVFTRRGQPVAGMMRLPEPAGAAPSHWLPYFAVEDCDAVAEQAWEVGGSILVPPSDVPEVGRFAVVRDPQGATFCLLARAPQPA